jgi:predicted MPP superfamily phosphohydrolase
MFFVFFLGVIGLLHYVLYNQLTAAWPQNQAFFALAVLLLFSLPLLMILARIRQRPGATRFFALTGFTWLGLLFVVDCLLGLFALVNVLLPLFGPAPMRADTIVWSTLGVAALAIAWGVREARTPRTRSVDLEMPGLKTSARPFRLVQITDLHLGYVANPDRLSKLVAQINALDPDLVVSTGDLFDSDFEKMDPMVHILEKLRARHGKFAISGNHEVYEDLETGLELTRRAGFCVLRGEAVEVMPGLFVAGVDDAEALPSDRAGDHETKALAGISEEAGVVLLKHRPTIRRASLGHFNLQLSGHTHGGQIFPFGLLTRLVYRHGPGLSRVGPGSWLYLSRGTGTWGPQFRILAPPEITVFDLRGHSD